MRILFLSNYYPPQHLGGYEELCQDVASGLRVRGHKVTILTSRPRVGDIDGDLDTYRILETEVSIGDPLATPRLLLGRRGRIERNRRRLTKVLEQVNPEVAIIWGMWNLSPDIAARLETILNERVLYYVADDWPILPEATVQHLGAASSSKISRVVKAILAVALPQSKKLLTSDLRLSHVACVSQATLDTVASTTVQLGDAEVIHNGIHLERFPSSAANAPVPCPPLRLILIGRLTAEKGCFVALDAVARACAAGHDVLLSLVGSAAAEEETRMRHAIRSAGLTERVQFMGRVTSDAVPALLASHHVLLVPSQVTDAMPRSAQEGMAAGLVVVASRLGGLPELVNHDENGLLFPPGDAAALALAIGRLAGDPALRRRLAEAGRRRVASDFDIQKTVERVEARLTRLLDDPLPALPRK